MARKPVSEAQSGNASFSEALAQLLQNQASFLGRMIDLERANAERFARIDERLGRIEAILLEHSRALAEHARLLHALPEAVREKIGFKAPP